MDHTEIERRLSTMHDKLAQAGLDPTVSLIISAEIPPYVLVVDPARRWPHIAHGIFDGAIPTALATAEAMVDRALADGTVAAMVAANPVPAAAE